MKHFEPSRALLTSAILSLTVLSVLSGHAAVKVIYGVDNRLELSQVTDPAILKLADSTAAMIPHSEISSSANNGRLAIRTTGYGAGRGLCLTERFYELPEAAYCSGFLVGPDLLVTAGHCIESSLDCSSNAWVFNFNAKTLREGSETSVPESEVYSCKEILAQTKTNAADYALIRLDRKVPNHAPLAIRRQGTIAVGDGIVTIGHPSGLPTIVTPGARVRSNDEAEFFVANLDTYGGNSGSAVFNSTTGLVEGILVRGEDDFVYDPVNGCTKSNQCSDADCRGEDVTRISLLVAAIDRASPAPVPNPVPSPAPSPAPSPGLNAQQLIDGILKTRTAPQTFRIGNDKFIGYEKKGYKLFGVKKTKCFISLRKGSQVIQEKLSACDSISGQSTFNAIAKRYLNATQ